MARQPLLLLCLLVTVLLACASCVTASQNEHGNGHGNHNNNNHGGGRCIPCNSCKDNWCWSNCKRDCPNEGGIKVNIELCKGYGVLAGGTSAQKACDLTKQFCKGGGRSFGAPQRTMVSLQQCGNAAFGVCQERGMRQWLSPCGWAFNRQQVDNCDKAAFMNFYKGVLDAECNEATAVFDKPQG